MHPAWLFAALLFFCRTIEAAPFQTVTLQSRSGQFVVGGLPMAARADAASAVIGGIMLPVRAFNTSTSAVSFVRLDPALVAVSCEEIKSALLKELGAADHWKGGVRVLLHPIRDEREEVYFTSVRNPNGWNYRLEMPDQIDRSRFIRAVVQAVVEEMANRGAGRVEAELPPWLTIGLGEHLEANSLFDLTLELQSGISQRRRNHDPLAKVRDSFRNSAPLTLDQLDWPSADLMAHDEELYRRCSHLLVHELLRLREGKSSILRLIEQAHENLNWQTTFFKVFANQFPRLIDLDKWWTLRAVQLSHGQELSRFTPEETLRQLDDILTIRAVAHGETNQLPSSTVLTIQQLIRNWPLPEQRAVLSERLQQLQSLALRAPTASLRLIEQYRAAFTEYLGRRNAAVRIKAVLKHLDALDAEREKLKVVTPPSLSTASAQPSLR
jgi:hypothetical protein